MQYKELNVWFNYRTRQYDYRDTPTDFSDYVPQIGGVGLYKIYVDCYGMTPIEAAIKVLSAAVGDTSHVD